MPQLRAAQIHVEHDPKKNKDKTGIESLSSVVYKFGEITGACMEKGIDMTKMQDGNFVMPKSFRYNGEAAMTNMFDVTHHYKKVADKVFDVLQGIINRNTTIETGVGINACTWMAANADYCDADPTDPEPDPSKRRRLSVGTSGMLADDK